MNFREGMRRVGLVLGGIGFCAGCFVSNDYLDPLLRQRAEAKQFQADEVIIKNLAPRSRFDVDRARKSGYTNREIIEYLSSVGPIPSGTSAIMPETVKADPLVRAAREWGAEPEAPSLWQYLPALAFPLLGFLVPWGTLKTLTWIGMGFAIPRTQNTEMPDTRKDE